MRQHYLPTPVAAILSFSLGYVTGGAFADAPGAGNGAGSPEATVAAAPESAMMAVAPPPPRDAAMRPGDPAKPQQQADLPLRPPLPADRTSADGDREDMAAVARVVETLGDRVAALERQVSDLQRQRAREPGPLEADPVQVQPSLGQRRELNVSRLVEVGLEDTTAQSIVELVGQQELETLELYDRAAREGWYGSEDYFDALREVRQGQVSVRERFGDYAYDRYLLASGQPNRVTVMGILEGSTAQAAGLQAGDIIMGYDGDAVFTVDQLRQATTAGVRDEMVMLEIDRGGTTLQRLIPRGPIGVQIEAVQRLPAAG